VWRIGQGVFENGPRLNALGREASIIAEESTPLQAKNLRIYARWFLMNRVNLPAQQVKHGQTLLQWASRAEKGSQKQIVRISSLCRAATGKGDAFNALL
jgi:hypothetical protein